MAEEEIKRTSTALTWRRVCSAWVDGSKSRCVPEQVMVADISAGKTQVKLSSAHRPGRDQLGE